jgi:hypothetical protein
MMAYLRKANSTRPPARRRSVRPLLEGLEDRLLLYSTLGAQWTYGSRITYSFVPDGTCIGGTPSVLFQTLNAKFPTVTWQQQFQKAAAAWEAVANINLSQVSDDGSPEGVNGNQQDDPRFGDIRISAIPQSSGTLAVTFLPPPINGGTDAGDIIFNSNTNRQINSSYDIETVAIHEFGHALGMGHSQITTACMYAYYNATKQSLTSDDISGIQSIWQAPQLDQFNSNGQNNGSYTRATNITSYIDANSQIAIPSLAISSLGQTEWFCVTAPSSTTGTMVVKLQSSNLSSLSPKLLVTNSSLQLLGQVGSPAYGDTVSVTVSCVQPGHSFYIRTGPNAGGELIGGFGLEVNFGSQTQSPIPPPNTVVAQQPDQGGGSINAPSPWIRVGNLDGFGEALTASQLDLGDPLPPTSLASMKLTASSDAFSGALGFLANPLGPQGKPMILLQGDETGTVVGPALPVSGQASTTVNYQVLDSVLATWSDKLFSLLAS